jgi:GNAT superfamily N-acetyltransferase
MTNTEHTTREQDIQPVPVVDETEIERRLTAFLESRLGVWPPAKPLEIVSWPLRDEPGWNNEPRPMVGIESPAGTVLSLSPTHFPDAASIDPVEVEDALGTAEGYMTIPALFGRPDMHFGRAVFRYVAQPADYPEIGEWVPNDDPRLPAWLRPFNDHVLVVWDEAGTYAAGVGLKKHNRFGHEISVGTEPGHRGKGLARTLVAQAARQVLRDGAVPIYLHGDRNAASLRVADQAGFPDRGWHLVELR